MNRRVVAPARQKILLRKKPLVPTRERGPLGILPTSIPHSTLLLLTASSPGQLIIAMASLPETMLAVQYKEQSTSGLETVALPVIGDNDVLIEVHSAGLNFAEVMAKKGLYPDAPRTYHPTVHGQTTDQASQILIPCANSTSCSFCSSSPICTWLRGRWNRSQART